MSRHMQRGFSVVEAAVVLAVAAVVGIGAYLVYDGKQNSAKPPTASDQTHNGTAPEAPAVSSSDDLDSASKALDSTNLDASVSDADDLDKELNNF